MRRSRFSEGQIVRIIKEIKAGRPGTELCREHAISETAFCNWKAKYGGMGGFQHPTHKGSGYREQTSEADVRGLELREQGVADVGSA